MEYGIEYQQVINVNVDDTTYTLNLMGTVFNIDGSGGSTENILITDVLISFTEGVTEQTIDVSNYVKPGVNYMPILVVEDFVSSHVSWKSVYLSGMKRVKFYSDGLAPTGTGATGNYIVLIPVNTESGAVGGLCNGQYYGEWNRSYSKAEIDSMIAGLDGGEVVKIYPVTVSITEGSTEATVDVTSYIEQDKSYLPIAVFQQASIANVLGYCELSHSSNISSMHFYSNGHVVGDLGVHVYLIPIKSSTATTTKGLTNGIGDISSSMSGYQTVANLVTSVDSSSTDSQYPSAKLFYDTCGDIETLINAL